MATYYLCTATALPSVVPGKLVQSTDKAYALLVGFGALLWPAADPVVAAAAAVARAHHGTRGGTLEELQAIMLAGCLRSLQANGMAGAVLVNAGNTGLAVLPGGNWYLGDTSVQNVSATLAPGTFDGEPHTFQVGAGVGSFTVNSLNGVANIVDPGTGALTAALVLSGFGASRALAWNNQLARWL